MLSTYGETHSLLNPTETDALKGAQGVLDRLGLAAGKAKDQVNRSAKKVAADEESRSRAAVLVAEAAFPSISMTDAILLLCHLHGNDGVRCYELGEIKRTRPDQIRGSFFLREVDEMQRQAHLKLGYRIKERMQTGISVEAATAVVTAIQAEFEAVREDLMASHAKLIEHAVICMTAAMLEQSK